MIRFRVLFCVFSGASLVVLELVFVFSMFPLCCFLTVSISAINFLERNVSKMTCYVSSGMLNCTHSLIHYQGYSLYFVLRPLFYV